MSDRGSHNDYQGVRKSGCERSNGHRNSNNCQGGHSNGGFNRSNNDDNNDEKVKMFEPHNVGKQPTDVHSKVPEEILITIAKHCDGGQIAELIGEDDCKDTNVEKENQIHQDHWMWTSHGWKKRKSFVKTN